MGITRQLTDAAGGVRVRGTPHPHDTSRMAVMQQRAKGIGQSIIRVNGTPYMMQDHFNFGNPFLQGNMLDVNVAAAIRRALDIGHHDGFRIILVDFGGFQLAYGDLNQNSTQERCNFGSANGCDEFTLSGAETD
jgi:hypothetical protein